MSGFQSFVEYLRVELEDAKTALVKADVSQFQRLQGRAQMLAETLDLVDPQPPRRMTVQPIP